MPVCPFRGASGLSLESNERVFVKYIAFYETVRHSGCGGGGGVGGGEGELQKITHVCNMTRLFMKEWRM